MSTLEELKLAVSAPDQRIAASCTIDLTPSDFIEEWVGRPRQQETFGIRSLTENDMQTVLSEARKADQEKRESSLLLGWVARSLCEPLDVTRAHRIFPMPDILIPIALKPDTIRRIWDTAERYRVETSKAYGEATDDEIARLQECLADGMLELLEISEANKVRRYLRFALDLLEATDGD